MTITSMGCGGAAALNAPDPAILAAVGGGDATDAGSSSSPFSMMLSGMSETPVAATEAQVLATLEEVEDPALLDPAPGPDAATLAIVAALMPGMAAISPEVQPTPLASGDSVTATAAAARLPEVTPPDSESLAAAWLSGARSAGSKPLKAIDPQQDTLDAVESVAHLETLAAPANGTVGAGAPAAGFSPMMQVAQLGNAIAQTTNVPLPQAPLQHSVGTARWAEELGTRLTLMASQGQMSGSLTLSPEHLGPLHVQIDIKNDVANVWFGSQHADTRAALHDALPRLRDMFGASGLVLGDTGVSRDTPRQEAQAAEVRRFASQREDAIAGTVEHRAQMSHLGLLDTYA